MLTFLPEYFVRFYFNTSTNTFNNTYCSHEKDLNSIKKKNIANSLLFATLYAAFQKGSFRSEIE